MRTAISPRFAIRTLLMDAMDRSLSGRGYGEIMTSDTFASLPLGHASTPGLAIPQLGFGVWEVPDAGGRCGLRPGARGRLPPHRHRADLRQRGGRRPGARVDATCDRDDVFVTTKVWNDDHRDVPAAFDASMAAARHRDPRPLPHPLAGPEAGRLRRRVEGDARAPARGTGPLGRRLQLPGAAPAAAARRDRCAARRSTRSS